MMMNRLYNFTAASIIASLVLFSCQSDADRGNQEGVEMPSENVILDTEHNSENSIDYEGLYSGTIPCADCEGVFTELILKPGNQFSITTKYLGTESDEVFSKSGNYQWIDGNRIELLGIEDAPNKYLVGENQVWQLDMQGDRITGSLESKYILKKKI